MKSRGHVQVIDFRVPTTLSALAVHIGVSAHLLEAVVSDERQARFYKESRIPKRRPTQADGYRVVWQAASFDLEAAHKQVSRKFDGFAREFTNYPTPYSHGYIRGRSTFTNASVHAGSRLLLTADLKSFFETITTGRLCQMFISFGMHPEAARVLSKFVTINGSLPLGLHASPLLSNLVCIELDHSLANLAEIHQATYSRYADDLAFSSAESLPTRIEIESRIQAEGFNLHQDKFRITKRGQAHYVTGLSISDPSPRIPRSFKRHIRQELYFSQKFGLLSHLGKVGDSSLLSGANRIDGSIRYISSVEKDLGERLRSQWRSVLDKDKVTPSFGPRHEREPWNLTLLVDEAEVSVANNQTVLVIGCVAIEDIEAAEQITREVATGFMDDPYSSGNKALLKKRGLHFVEASEEIRTEYIKRLSEMPFRAYLSYGLLNDPSDYEELYIQLLSALLPHRFIDADRAKVSIVVEQNSKISPNKICKYIEGLYQLLATRKSRRPLSCPEYKTGKKSEDPCLAMVDFVLGVFGQYAAINVEASLEEGRVAGPKKPGETARKRFERLRDKIRVIIAKPTAETYFRKKPFLPWINGDPSICEKPHGDQPGDIAEPQHQHAADGA